MTTASIQQPQRQKSGLPSLVAAFIRRDWKMARSYRLAFVLQFVGSLFSLVLVYFLSKFMGPSIADRSGQLQEGYFAFAAMGLTLLSLVMTALNIFGRQLRTEQQTGTFEALLTTPTPPWLILLGSSCYELLFAVAASAVTLVLAITVFGMQIRFELAPDCVAVLTVVVSVCIFSALGILYAAVVVVFKGGTAAMGLITGGMALIGGVYYPTSVFPSALRVLAQLFPLAQSANLVRQTLLLGELPLAQLGVLFCYAVVLVPIALWLFSRAVRRARRQGTLGQY
jgi:ABC-2 type transport system permease protein